MLILHRLENDLLLLDNSDNEKIFKFFDTAYTSRFTETDVRGIIKLLEEYTNLIFAEPLDFELFIKIIANSHSTEQLHAEFNHENNSYEIHSIDDSSYYMIVDVIKREEEKLLFIVYPFKEISLYGSALAYFRNKAIDEILNDL